MNRIPHTCSLLILALLLLKCATPEKSTTDFETIVKDDKFRNSIKTGGFVKLSNGYTYYELNNQNTDTIIVFVHGFSVPSYIWDSTFQAIIKRGYSALRYDTYGRGYSDCPDAVYDVALYSNQLKELLDALNIAKPITLLGLSDGGRTISAFAFQYPQMISNLVYVDAAGFNTVTDTTSYPSFVSDDEVLAFKQTDSYANMASGQMTDFYDSVPFRGWDKRYREIMQYKGFVRALLSTNKNRTDLEVEHRKIAKSGMPVFAIWGEHDAVVKLDEIKTSLLDRIPNVKLTVIPKAGHLPHMEQALQFNSILINEIISKK